jgi:exodeoxyribonuclease VII small subunit
MARTSSKKTADVESGKAPSFEAALERLEHIVERLDDGNLPLEESLALFKEGTQLAKLCRALLAEAEVQVKEALRDIESAEDIEEDDDAEDENDRDDDDQVI